MRGSPILRALAAFLALLALAPALWRLTRTGAPLVRAAPAHSMKNARTEVRLTFSTSAKNAVIEHLGRAVWSKAAPSLEENFICEIPWPPEGIELHVLAAWPAETHHAALRVRLTAPDGNEAERTAWGDANTDAVLTFP